VPTTGVGPAGRENAALLRAKDAFGSGGSWLRVGQDLASDREERGFAPGKKRLRAGRMPNLSNGKQTFYIKNV
jgi:hypothetical protein